MKRVFGFILILSLLCGVLLILTSTSSSPVGQIQKYILPLDVQPWGNQSSKDSHIALVKIGYSLAKEFQLHFISYSGRFTFIKTPSNTPTYGLDFVSDKQLSLEGAKQLANSLFNIYLERASQDSYVQKSLEEHENFYSQEKHDWKTVLAFTITFWDEKLEYHEFPSVARIHYFDSLISIFYADPKTGRLELAWSGKLDQSEELNKK